MAKGFRFSGSFTSFVLGLAASSALWNSPTGVALAAPQTSKVAQQDDLLPPPFPLPGDVVFGTPHLRAPANCVTFSPDGKFAVEAGSGPIRFWDIASGMVHDQLESTINTFQTLCYSPDGKLMAASGVGGALAVWDAETHEEVFANEGSGEFDRTIISLVFSPDGNRLLTGTQDMRMQVWDAKSGEQLTEDHLLQNRRPRAPTVVAWSPEGKLIAATSSGKIHVYDAETYAVVHEIPAHQQQITGLVFTSDAQLVSAGTERLRVDGGFQQRGVVRIWKMSRGSLLRQLKFTDPPTNVQAICLTPDGEHIVMSARNDIRIVRLKDAEVVRRFGSFPMEQVQPQGLAISADGKYVARATSGGVTFRLFDTESATRVTYSGATGHDRSLQLSCVSPDSTVLATIASDGRVLFWDAQSGENTGTFQCGPDTLPQAAVWSEDGEKLFVAGSQSAPNQPRGFAVGIDVRDVSEVMRAGFDDPVIACGLSVDGRQLAMSLGFSRRTSRAAASGSILQILSADSGLSLARIEGTMGYGHLKFSPDNRHLFAMPSTFGESMDLWDLRNGTVFRKERLTTFRSSDFSASSQRISVLTTGNQVQVYDALTMKQLAVVQEPNRRYLASVISADGRLLATTANRFEMRVVDGGRRITNFGRREISVWNIDTRELVYHVPKLELDASQLKFSPDGNWLYATVRSGVAMGWDLRN